MISTNILETPFGEMIAGVRDDVVCLFDFYHRKSIDSIKQRVALHMKDYYLQEENPIFKELSAQINAFAQGRLKEFSIPTVFCGTDFQKSVWQHISEIPYGETLTYQKLALKVGDENMVRAVAGATGDNCLAIIVPCHRIIGANGSLTGYSGGVDVKKRLLQLEMANTLPKSGTLF